MTTWNALIIDPDERSRSHLKQLANIESKFDNVKSCPDLFRASQILNEKNTFDLIFISHDIGSAERMSFLESARNFPASSVAAIVQVAEATDADEIIEEAMNCLSGADATLFSPFSVDELVKISQSALAARGAEISVRQKSAIIRVVQKLLGNIDDTATRLSEIAPIARSLTQLEQSSRPIKELPNGLHDLYFETLLEVLDHSNIPGKIRPGAKYKSPNLKKKNYQKLEDFIGRES
ncbi:MAG: hypothetical protein KDD56_07560 [Bdellovibrionales bacterium]|nr:hypothetical protein [Bdellovibrionales bacterium]